MFFWSLYITTVYERINTKSVSFNLFYKLFIITIVILKQIWEIIQPAQHHVSEAGSSRQPPKVKAEGPLFFLCICSPWNTQESANRWETSTVTNVVVEMLMLMSMDAKNHSQPFQKQNGLLIV